MYFLRSVLILLFIVGHFSIKCVAQSEVDVIVESYSIPNLPGLHSYTAAQYDGKWILIGGRTDGLHLRQPNTAFLSLGSNNKIYVVDPVSTMVWSAPVNSLPASINEQLQSTNMLYCQDAGKLYLAGGYGYSASVNNHISFPSLVVIDLAGLTNAVITGSTINSYFRQLNDNLFALTGGQMDKLGEMFLLVGGHRFDGTYNPSNGPSFTQAYSNQVRQFRLNDDGISLSISFQNVLTDAAALHRRDFNLVPQVFPDRSLGFTAFSGVFKTNVNLPFLNSVDIDTVGYYPNATFTQSLNHYHCGYLAAYDSTANLMHNIFFGGMAQFYFDAGGNMVQDNEVPFVSTIGKVTRNGAGVMTETKLSDLPGFLGSGAVFFLNKELPLYQNDVISLNRLAPDTVVAGFLVGGIQSIAPNIFFVNTGTQSSAVNNVYKISLVKNAGTIPVRLLYFKGRRTNEMNTLEWQTSFEQNNRYFLVERSINGNDYLPITKVISKGNDVAGNFYSFIDEHPARSLNYYRLRQVDIDNHSVLSKVIIISNETESAGFLVYPNPVKEKLIIEFNETSDAKLPVKIFDVKGNLLSSQKIPVPSRQIMLNVSALQNGIYFLQVEIHGKIYTRKFVIEHE